MLLAKPPTGKIDQETAIRIRLCALYGFHDHLWPETLVNDVCDFFQDVEMYLQDPKGCDTNVKYCNPHRLSSLYLDDYPMTFDVGRLGAETDPTLFQKLSSEPDDLDIFDAHQSLPEAPQPDSILPSLKR